MNRCFKFHHWKWLPLLAITPFLMAQRFSAGRPDLIIQNVEITVRSSSSISLRLTIANQGAAATGTPRVAPPVELEAWPRGVRRPGESPVTILNRGEILNPGQVIERTVQVPFDAWWILLIDSGNSIRESDETNNKTAVFRNHPPSLGAIPNQTLIEGEEWQLTLTASDVESDAFRFSASGLTGEPLPEGMTFDATTGEVRWTPQCHQSGNYRIRFTVTETEEGLTDSQNITLQVREPTPEVVWTYQYHAEPDGYEVAHDMAITSSGDLLVTGVVDTAEEGRNTWLGKISPNGTLLWQKDFNGTYGSNDEGLGIALDPTGNIFLTGFENDTLSSGYSTLFVKKLDLEGNEVWSYNHWELNLLTAFGSAGRDIVVDPDGDVFMTGYDHASLNPFGAGPARLFIGKFTSDGTAEWTQTYDGPYLDGQGFDSGLGITVDSSKNVYVTGEEEVGSINRNIWIRKMDLTGNEIWTTRYAGFGEQSMDKGRKIIIDQAGSIYVIGHLHEEGSKANIWIAKLDSGGNEIWHKTYDGENQNPLYDIDVGTGIAFSGDGGLYATGSVHIGSLDYDIWIQKLDANGNISWTEIVRQGSGKDLATSIAADSAGHFYVAGTVTAAPAVWTTYNLTWHDIWVRKYRDRGVCVP